MFINFWSKYSKQQCSSPLQEDERHVWILLWGIFALWCWQLSWKILEVFGLPLQLSLNLVVLKMCSHFLNLTKLGATKIHDQKNTCATGVLFFPLPKSLILVKSWILAEKKRKKHFSLFKKLTGKVRFFWRFISKQITQQN